LIEAAPLVIAHNASFDVEMVDIEAARCGAKIVWPRCLCTVEQSSYVIGHRLTLGALHEHLLGEKFEGAHRAKVDVAALIRCVAEMVKRGML
jgi:DNA polymerase III epsilon subunit-like protein